MAGAYIGSLFPYWTHIEPRSIALNMFMGILERTLITIICCYNQAVAMPLGGGPPSLQLSTALAVSGSLLVLVWYLMQKKRQQNSLPGPTSLPLVGNLIQFINNKECIPQMFNRWTDKYGPIFVIRIGQVDAIVINTMDLIREAFSVRAMVFSERPSSLPLIKKIYQGKGIHIHICTYTVF